MLDLDRTVGEGSYSPVVEMDGKPFSGQTVVLYGSVNSSTVVGIRTFDRNIERKLMWGE